MRMYGFGALQPCGYCFLASSSLTEPAIMTSSPFFQFTGVATLCLAGCKSLRHRCPPKPGDLRPGTGMAQKSFCSRTIFVYYPAS